MPLASLGEALNEFDSHPVSGCGLGVMLRRLLGNATGGLNLLLQLGETVESSFGLLTLGHLRCHDVVVVADLLIDPSESLDDLVNLLETCRSLVECMADGLQLLPFLESSLPFLAGGGLVVHLVLGTHSVHETADRTLVGLLTACLLERCCQSLGGVQPQWRQTAGLHETQGIPQRHVRSGQQGFHRFDGLVPGDDLSGPRA